MMPSLQHPRGLRALPIAIGALVASVASLALAGTANAAPITASHVHSSDWASSPRTWTVQVGAENGTQEIQGMSFLPENVFVDAGDTVHWVANSAEIHTVTFLAAGESLGSYLPFDPSSPKELLPMGGSVYDGSSYYNSGVLANVSDTGFPSFEGYSLTFPTPGDYTYYCLVHGAAMTGHVHVAAAGTPYPYTQAQYDRDAKVQEHALLRDGHRLALQTRRLANKNTVIMGADDGMAMLMRFYKSTLSVHVGDSVTFVNNGMGEPHTVTFGQEPANPGQPVGDPAAYSGGALNSGILPPGATFTVTFTKAGKYPYICALHDYMGMVGKIIVHP